MDFDKYVDGDARGNYLESGTNSSYLLYWWHKLDMEGFVKFKNCTLDKLHRVNLTDFQLVSSEHQSQSPSRRVGRKEEIKNQIMTKTVGSIGDGIKTLGMITVKREIETWQKELFDMEEIMEKLDEKDNNSTRGERTRKRVERHIGELKGQINDTKKMCDNLR